MNLERLIAMHRRLDEVWGELAEMNGDLAPEWEASAELSLLCGAIRRVQRHLERPIGATVLREWAKK